LLREQQKFDEAELLLQEGVAMNRAVLPAGHADIGTSLTHLAALRQDRGQSAEAEKLYREALEIHQASLPAGHPQIASDLISLAGLLRENGELAEAEQRYRESISLLAQRFGNQDHRLAEARIGLGRTLTALSRFAEAETQLLDAERDLRGADGESNGRHAACVTHLLKLYEGWAASGDQDAGLKLRQWRANHPATRSS
jgi:tetratricopeptide (TPR) repeat protein